MALEINDSNFEEIIGQETPVVVDFWAEWCGPCKMISPIVDKLMKKYEGKVTIAKLNVDENDDSCQKYGIRNIPTILFFKNGQVVDKQVGATTEAALEEKINALL